MARLAPGMALALVALVASGAGSRAWGASCTVPSSAACPTLQAALDQAGPGDVLSATAGVYFETIHFPSSGSAAGGFITLQGAPGHASVLDGTGVAGENMVLIESRSYVRISGFEIRNHLGVTDGSGIRVVGSGSHIEIRDNLIHDMHGRNAMGITVYGTEPAPLSSLVIDGNEIRDCDPAPSEALTLNGNVDGFEVTHNHVHDVNNIGIDFIGGETDIQPDTGKVVRNGTCRGNLVERARSSYGGGFAGAIYVDGGRDILIEGNVTTESDLGLEVGAENAGLVTSGVVVRDNIFHHNDKAGLVFGGYAASVGRVKNCSFTHNTLYHNDTLGEGFGELWIQYAEGNRVRNNLFAAGQPVVLNTGNGNVGNDLDYNLWTTRAADGPTFLWRGQALNGLDAFRAAAGQETHGVGADPELVDPEAGDFHLRALSPAHDAGDPAFVPGSGETDMDGAPRVSGAAVDIGADEASCGNLITDPGESCDDGNLVECDGCDSNCTPSTSCGNGIRCSAEQCDDGNTAGGDCCDPSCQFEAAGSGCDDGGLCTNDDACDGAGTCAGSPTPLPAPLCRPPALPQRSSLRLKDRTPDSLDRIQWTWRRGTLTTSADFGDPTRTTRYALCVYDQSTRPQPLLDAGIEPGGLCRGRPCWRKTRGGFRFASRVGTASSSGLTRLVLAEGAEGKSRITLAGRGTFLPDPALGWTGTVVAQLRNSAGGCWGASFPTASRNDAAEYNATSE